MIEVILKGLEVTVQDYPGRIGYLNLGIPPAGPMDDLALRLGNILVGNPDGEAGLEVLLGVFKVRFHGEYVIAVTGANVEPKLNDQPIPMWEAVKVKPGDILSLGMVKGPGLRAYLAVSGGIDVPKYLGSKATFAGGKMGGFEGRPLKEGDKLKVGKPFKPLDELVGRKVKRSVIPEYGNVWEVAAIPGPQAAPDFFTEEDMKTFFSIEWKVDRNSNRMGYRLQSYKWQWARKDGGIAGMHPSNILDNGYAVVGTVNVCGDQPIILTADGPSLGGFVCNATIIRSSMWKIGQAVPGKDLIKFRKVTHEEALKLREEYEKIFSEESIET